MFENYFTDNEKILVLGQCKTLIKLTTGILSQADITNIHRIIKNGIAQNRYHRDKYGINPTIRNLNTAILWPKTLKPTAT